VIIISIFTEFFKKAKKHNIASGLIIFEIVSIIFLFLFILYILPFYLFYYGDIGVIIAGILSMYFTFHNRKVTQRILKIILIFIFVGTLIISFSLSIIEGIYSFPNYGLNPIVFLSFFVSNLIMVFIYTIIIGLFMAYYYSNKERNSELIQ
jgi:magnesium-transporting ATPase (P-type)